VNRPPINTIQLPDDAEMRMQRQFVAGFEFLYGQPFGQPMVLRKNISLTTAFTTVRHGLGRPMQGYLVVRSSGPAMFSDADATTDTNNNVQIKASGATTASLLFF
jgi:hypothetical protein